MKKLASILIILSVMALIFGQPVSDPATRPHVRFDNTFTGTTGVAGATNGVVLDDGCVATGNRVLLDTGAWADVAGLCLGLPAAGGIYGGDGSLIESTCVVMGCFDINFTSVIADFVINTDSVNLTPGGCLLLDGPDFTLDTDDDATTININWACESMYMAIKTCTACVLDLQVLNNIQQNDGCGVITYLHVENIECGLHRTRLFAPNPSGNTARLLLEGITCTSCEVFTLHNPATSAIVADWNITPATATQYYGTDACSVLGYHDLTAMQDGDGIYDGNGVIPACTTATGNLTFTGTLAASNLSGTNTGDQTITLTGDVTGSGTGSFATAIANNVIGLPELSGGTDGNLYTFDACGDPAFVATGTSGQVVTSNGVGTAPTMQALVTHQVLTDGTTITWDQSVGTFATLTLTDAVGTRTLNITNDVVGQSFLILIQDSTDGLELIATWDSSIKWTTGQTPTLSEGLSEEDVVVLFSDGTTQYGFTGYDYQ